MCNRYIHLVLEKQKYTIDVCIKVLNFSDELLSEISAA